MTDAISSNNQVSQQDPIENNPDVKDAESAVAFQDHLDAADAGQKTRNSSSSEVSGALANVQADKPATAQAYATDEVSKAIGGDLTSAISSAPAAAQKPLADAADSYAKMVQAHSSGDVKGAFSAASNLQDLLDQASKAGAGSNPALANAQSDVGTAMETLKSELGPTDKLAAGTKNSLDGSVSKSLDKLNSVAPNLSGPAADNVNALRSTGGDLVGLAARLGNPAATPADQKAQDSIKTAIGDYNKLANAAVTPGQGGLKGQSAAVQKLGNDVKDIVSALAKTPAAQPGGGGVSPDVVSNLTSLNKDVIGLQGKAPADPFATAKKAVGTFNQLSGGTVGNQPGSASPMQQNRSNDAIAMAVARFRDGMQRAMANGDSGQQTDQIKSIVSEFKNELAASPTA